MAKARNNRSVGNFGKQHQENIARSTKGDPSKEQSEYEWLILDVCGPKGFGKCPCNKKGMYKTSSYYYYTLINISTGVVLENILAGDGERKIEDECGFTKAGFIGKICCIKYIGIDNRDNATAYIRSLSEASLRRHKPGRIKNKMKESIKFTLHGLWEPIANAGEQLKALLDDWDE